ncbi:histidine phosphatase family protein [Salibacteraceae bacterium]|nr:histidine phosphatase family protein [Salibacteraceae bacterium]MDB9708805.1 histidine phosphatase family protein [Salibacteraceae bacterium]MDC1304950.1 histidine phosphatase family protein [Salibacteraceae bacterium]HAQ69531.1 hypothetical protein [Flavobacteriales bacterium]
MKTLYIARHGKSDWDNLDLNDIERPLKNRGVQNCKEMSEVLRIRKSIPEIIFSSPAVRAYESAKIFADELSLPLDSLKVDGKLYLPDFPTMLKTILYLDNHLQSAMIVGHEPSISSFVNFFIQQPIEKIATASVTALEFNILDWREISAANFKKGWHINRHYPKGFSIT